MPGGGRRAHQSDAPGFALEVAEAAADFEVVVAEQRSANLHVAHPLRNSHQGEGREPNRSVDGKLESELLQSSIERLGLLAVPCVAAFQPFVEREPERSMECKDHVDGGSVMVDALAAEVLPEQAQIRYQLRTGVLRFTTTSRALSENETGESPGGQERHFCVPE